MCLITGVGDVGIEMEDCAGGEGNLLEDVGPFKRMDILQDQSDKTDYVFSGWWGTEGVVGMEWGVNSADGDGEFRGLGRWLGFTLVGVSRVRLTAGIAGGRGCEVGTLFMEVMLFAVGAGGWVFTIFSKVVIILQTPLTTVSLSGVARGFNRMPPAVYQGPMFNK